MRKIMYSAGLISLVFFSTSGWCAKIVYPFRATTAVVVSGSTFEVWFSADAGQTVDSITLKGPYNSVSTTFSTASASTWTYDQWSGNTCNRKLVVTVPSDAPADKYDLLLNTSTGTVQSTQSVKVIKGYKSSFYIMHITDAHRWESSGDPDKNKTLREISKIIDVANILDPEFLVETGDNFWGNNESEADRAARAVKMWSGYMLGTERIQGLHDAFAAVLSTPGNHDCRTNNDYLEPDTKRPSQDWNLLYGLQNFGIVYGSARIIGANVGWAMSGNTWQFDQQKAWIKNIGAGNMILGMCHKPAETATSNFYNAFSNNGTPFKWMLTGHTHKTSDNPWSVSGHAIGYTALINKYDPSRANCPFSLYKIDLAAGTFTPLGSKGGNFAISTAGDYNTRKLRLTYGKSNNGTSLDNEGTIVNNFTFPITGARIRFIMPKGNSYAVTGGTVKQAFDGTTYHIVDASFDINASSTKTVSIAKSTTAVVNGASVNSKTGFSLSGSQIAYSSSTPSMVSLCLYDMRGRVAGNLLSGMQQAGSHSFSLPGDLRAGVYVLTGRIGPERVSARVVIGKNR